MVGALGPLQAEAVQGVLSFAIRADGGGSAVTLRYAVSGQMGAPLDSIAPAVDGVLGEQARRLARASATP